jgi:hypothetical protein
MQGGCAQYVSHVQILCAKKMHADMHTHTHTRTHTHTHLRHLLCEEKKNSQVDSTEPTSLDPRKTTCRLEIGGGLIVHKNVKNR